MGTQDADARRVTRRRRQTVRQRLRTARCLCDFDSSVAAVRTVSRFLRGKDFRGLGVGPGSARLADLASQLPSPRDGTCSSAPPTCKVGLWRRYAE